tara:strand:+ start:3291 stop:3560 length:270 start_codon:yes stop_codon:yes gene_type:complete
MSLVEHPGHYNMGKIEVIDAIDDWELGFYEGNIIKYIARSKHKGNRAQDLQKARWYLDRLIAIERKHNEKQLLQEKDDADLERKTSSTG